MYKAPNHFVNQLEFEPLLSVSNQISLYYEQGADKAYPGPFGALKDHQKEIAKSIGTKFLSMVADHRNGFIDTELYRKYLRMYEQRLLLVNGFKSVPELNYDKMIAEIKSFIPQAEKLK